jgi:hypothetical protein
MIVRATLNLSTGATCDRLPSWIALKQNNQDRPVTIADMVRKKRLCFDKFPIPFVSPRANTIIDSMIKMIAVRIAVARFEFIFSTPCLAKLLSTKQTMLRATHRATT